MPQEITKQEKDRLLKEYKKESRVLNNHNDIYTPHHFLSREPVVHSYYSFSYIYQIPYRKYYKPGVVVIWHLIRERCTEAEPDTTAFCLATVRNGNTWKYYHCKHQVGRCPHKYTLSVNKLCNLS